jgi:hypothetical protein
VVEAKRGEEGRELVGRPRPDTSGGGIDHGVNTPDRDSGLMGEPCLHAPST